MIRVGQGFDLHRLEAGRPFMLGGIQLDWSKGPLGHSDGDVLLHAVIDALLGAAGLGDIGEWFPPSDDAFKGADSNVLFLTVLAKIHEADWQIANIDATILLEAPKLSLYKEKIRDQVAMLAKVEPQQVNIKAKTMEGLGAIGKEEAVAAMVSVLLLKPGTF
jgi:2-C-methyl-D-erythritol 2,4-cyclodiphosphate synthase